VGDLLPASLAEGKREVSSDPSIAPLVDQDGQVGLSLNPDPIGQYGRDPYGYRRVGLCSLSWLRVYPLTILAIEGPSSPRPMG